MSSPFRPSVSALSFPGHCLFHVSYFYLHLLLGCLFVSFFNAKKKKIVERKTHTICEPLTMKELCHVTRLHGCYDVACGLPLFGPLSHGLPRLQCA